MSSRKRKRNAVDPCLGSYGAPGVSVTAETLDHPPIAHFSPEPVSPSPPPPEHTITVDDFLQRQSRSTRKTYSGKRKNDLESDSVRRKSFSTRITAAASSIGINPSDEFVRLSSSSPPRPLTVVHRKTKKASRRMDPRRRQTLRSASFFSNNSSKNDTTVFNPISRRSNSFLQNCGPGSSTRMSAANTKYQHLSRTPLQFVPIAEAEASYARVRLRKRRAKSTEKPTCLLNSRKIKPHSDTVLSPELPSPMVEIPCAPCLKDDQATIAHGRMHTSFTSPICSQVHKPLMSRFPSFLSNARRVSTKSKTPNKQPTSSDNGIPQLFQNGADADVSNSSPRSRILVHSTSSPDHHSRSLSPTSSDL